MAFDRAVAVDEEYRLPGPVRGALADSPEFASTIHSLNVRRIEVVSVLPPNPSPTTLYLTTS